MSTTTPTFQFLNAFNMGDTISFQVFPSDIYGSNFTNMQVSSVVSAAACALFGFDAAAEHAKVLADKNVPMGQVPQSYNAYQYLVLVPPAAPSNFVVIGLPWIVQSTIQVLATRDAVGYFPNINDTQLTQLRLAISAVVPNFTLDYQ